MTLFSRSLWPDSVRSPYRRLAFALIVSPAVMSIILSAIAIVLVGLSEQSGAAARAAAADSALTLTVAIFAYTLTFGVVGVLVLWGLKQRGPAAWASTGLVAGALGGFMLSELAMDRGGPALVIFSSITSVALFLLVRAFAGIQDVESER